MFTVYLMGTIIQDMIFLNHLNILTLDYDLSVCDSSEHCLTERLVHTDHKNGFSFSPG